MKVLLNSSPTHAFAHSKQLGQGTLYPSVEPWPGEPAGGLADLLAASVMSIVWVWQQEHLGMLQHLVIQTHQLLSLVKIALIASHPVF